MLWFSNRFLASIYTSKVKSNSLILPGNTADMQFLIMFLGFPQVVQWLRICLAMQRIRVRSLIGKLRSHMIGFPHGSNDKESASNVGDPGLIPGSGRFPGKGNGLPLQYSWSSQVVQLVKNPSASARDIGDVGSISELGRSPGGENGNPLQYS